jgi:hypothetical protein
MTVSNWDAATPQPQPPGIPQLAVVSLVTGILGLVGSLCFAGLFVLGIVAVITGQIALNEIDGSSGTVPGRRVASIGRLLGAISIVLGVLFVVLVATGVLHLHGSIKA